jgi:thiol-disulfide isomerase/thioredoxin
MNKPAALILAVFAIALGAGIFYGLKQGSGIFPGANPAGPADQAASTASATASAATPTLAATIPDFKLADRNGDMKGLRDFGDKALIVNFWATWCAPCRREIPLLEKLQAEHGDEGFQVVGIAIDFRDKVLAFADEMQIGYPLLIGEQDALDAVAAFGVDMVGLPFTVFTDRQGRVIASHMGELHADQAEVFLAVLRRVEADGLTPADARREIFAGLSALPPRGSPSG